MLDADGFRHRDLHVIDITVVPQRFEEAVAEAKRHDVLDGFFAEIVIDSVDLILVQTRANLAIERVRRFQVVTERLLYDHSAPMPVGFFGESRGSQLLHDLAEETWRHRGIEERVSRRAVQLVGLLELRLESLVRGWIRKVARHVRDALVEPFPEFGA